MAVSMAHMPPASSIFSMYASISASIMLLQTMMNQLLPLPAQRFLLSLLRRLFPRRPSHSTLLIEERDGLSSNELFSAAETYLCSLLRPDSHRLKLTKRPNDPSLSLRFASSHSIPDSHRGIPLLWRFVNEEHNKHNKPHLDERSHHPDSEKRYFELTFTKESRDTVLESYIPSVLARAKVIKDQNKVVKLHTLAGAPSYSSSSVWDSVNLEHPSTFDTLAMEADLKKRIKEDLDRFVRRKDFYRRVGRAWKRGYLLYGPPGTGKSSLIAAMANYLKFDIYDLELTNVRRDSDLRKLLLRTANRSILVIEDIDCTVDLPDRKGSPAAVAAAVEGANAHLHRPRDTQFTLSGLLNFIDGLWSSCGDERIIVFTTNNKGKLDPALLRPGRMDMHIHMSYLTPDGFRLLASTYLGIQGHHPSLPEIENLIKMKNITPAEVAEELMKFDDVDLSLNEVLNFLKSKTNEDEDDTKTISEKDVEVGVAKDQVTAHDSDF
ncbi:AAA-ATPase At5g17750-like [Salvia hispanica]|uniref:AAA-ATPase At5g17750-like n=1 Tax=Salvia hispanica TaxID=49212 RepID=UPI0020090532|nr:AAA-ATPase At5g17750-like [Salvia hispanica]